MYSAIRNPLLTLIRAPLEPPPAPAGSHASIEIFRASPRYLTYRLIVWLLVAAFLALALSVALVASIAAGEIAALAVVLAAGAIAFTGVVVAYFAVRVDYDLRYYVLTDRSVRVREGAWTVRERTLTYANVQNLRIVQGPLQRLFGIRNLRVDAAGGGGMAADGKTRGAGHGVEIRGVENADALRDSILAHLRARGGAGAGAGLGDPDDEEEPVRSEAPVRGAAPSPSPAVLQALREVREASASLARAARAAPAEGG